MLMQNFGGQARCIMENVEVAYYHAALIGQLSLKWHKLKMCNFVDIV